jgi:hypothetical protein
MGTGARKTHLSVSQKGLRANSSELSGFGVDGPVRETAV